MGLGGAINVAFSSFIEILDSDFEGNVADIGGGILLSRYGEAVLSGLTFYNNTAQDNAGGVSIQTYTVGTTIRNTIFDRNHASDDAGGLAVHRGEQNLELYDVTFTGNTAGRQAGGLDVWISTINLTIDNCLFQDNFASGSYGAGWVHDDILSTTIRNTRVINNRAGDVGGFGTVRLASIVIEDSLFDGNTALDSFPLAQLDVRAKSFLMDNVTVINGVGGLHGGVELFGMDPPTEFIINRSLFQNNTGERTSDLVISMATVDIIDTPFIGTSTSPIHVE